MMQPELTPLATAPQLPRPGVLGRALGGLFFVLALVVFGFGLYNAAHAAGVAGTSGTLTVERCWVKHGSRGSSDTTECGGTFRSDDGKVKDDQASVRADLKPGNKVSVQQAGDWYVQTGFGETTKWLAAFFLGWLVVAFGTAFAATGMFPRSGMHVALITRSISGTPAGRLRKWFVWGGLAGAGVCLLLTLAAWLAS
ncbi:hypothetical protein [Streptomyces sp. NPDC046805]|uniref:hypothetical protein n=1 Tax=Streptomyces sp. NPDC046805 TaxID=3155134 RepID=UPI0033C27E2A